MIQYGTTVATLIGIHDYIYALLLIPNMPLLILKLYHLLIHKYKRVRSSVHGQFCLENTTSHLDILVSS